MIIGDDTRWKAKLDEETRQAIEQFETSDDGQGNVTRQRFDKARETSTNAQKSSEQYESIRKGILPPGVSSKTFTSKDDAEVYAVAVYIPSVSQQAAQTAKEMSQAQLLDNPNSGTGTVPAAPATQEDNTPRPQKDVAPGPTGTVSRDKDL